MPTHYYQSIIIIEDIILFFYLLNWALLCSMIRLLLLPDPMTSSLDPRDRQTDNCVGGCKRCIPKPPKYTIWRKFVVLILNGNLGEFILLLYLFLLEPTVLAHVVLRRDYSCIMPEVFIFKVIITNSEIIFTKSQRNKGHWQ